jgi:hypothetical protein
MYAGIAFEAPGLVSKKIPFRVRGGFLGSYSARGDVCNPFREGSLAFLQHELGAVLAVLLPQTLQVDVLTLSKSRRCADCPSGHVEVLPTTVVRPP